MNDEKELRELREAGFTEMRYAQMDVLVQRDKENIMIYILNSKSDKYRRIYYGNRRYVDGLLEDSEVR